MKYRSVKIAGKTYSAREIREEDIKPGTPLWEFTKAGRRYRWEGRNSALIKGIQEFHTNLHCVKYINISLDLINRYISEHFPDQYNAEMEAHQKRVLAPFWKNNPMVTKKQAERLWLIYQYHRMKLLDQQLSGYKLIVDFLQMMRSKKKPSSDGLRKYFGFYNSFKLNLSYMVIAEFQLIDALGLKTEAGVEMDDLGISYREGLKAGIEELKAVAIQSSVSRGATSKTQDIRNRIATQLLTKYHIEIDPNDLGSIPKDFRIESRTIAKSIIGNNPRRNSIMKELFRKPRRNRPRR